MIRAGAPIVNPATGQRHGFESGGSGWPWSENRRSEVVRPPVVAQVTQKPALLPGWLLGRAFGWRPTQEARTADTRRSPGRRRRRAPQTPGARPADAGGAHRRHPALARPTQEARAADTRRSPGTH
jgi:hypothetical protein